MIETQPTEEEIFRVACEIRSAAAREAYLDQACGANAKLRGRVLALLQVAEEEASFLERPPAAYAPTIERPALSEKPGDAIGPYKLRQEIGEGGFGVVFMAEQEKPVRRMVALKIIKAGMDTREVIARFESERQALAIMDHPNIAKVLDAGATAPTEGGYPGRPYFVMELVKGVPITEFCDRNHFPAATRLKLFIDVCHAIQHAHHKGVIHRDVKPTNVMVTLHDGVPIVKVIDFGVAKATVQKLTERTLFTAYGQMVGTPAYMSPEQAEMSGLDIDTRSDVYSLGVLLYELLTGTTPLDVQRLRTAGYAEMQRLICEEEPPRPSTRMSSLGASATVLAGNRGTDPRQLARLLAGDLDWIVMKALEKDRNRRYESASAFAADLRRFLAEEPVEARSPSALYRLRKLVRRNRAAVVTAAAIAAVLVLGTIGATWQAVRATRAEASARRESLRARDTEQQARGERDRAIAAEKRAQAERANAAAALEFISQGILSPASPDTGADPDIKLRTVVDQIAENLDKGVKQPPLVEASIRHALGNIFVFERFQEALRHFQRAYAIRKEVLGDQHPDTIRTLISLGHPDLWREEWRTKKESDQSEGERIAVEARRLAEEVLGPDDVSTLIAMRNVARFHRWAKRYQQAEKLQLQFLQECIRTRTESDAWSITAHIDLAWHYNNDQRQFDKAAGHANRAVELCRELYQTDDHYLTLLAIEALAGVYQRQERHADAEQLNRQLIDGFLRHVGPHSPSYLSARSSLAYGLNRQNKHQAAVAEFEDVLALIRQEPSYQNHLLGLGFALTGYGDSLNKLRRFAEAEPVLREALAIRHEDLKLDRAWAFNTQSILGETLIGLGPKRYEEAEDELKAAYQGQIKPSPGYADFYRPEFIQRTLERLVKLYEAWDKPDEAARWRQELEAQRKSETLP